MSRTHFTVRTLGAVALAGGAALAALTAGAGTAGADVLTEINGCRIVANPTPEDRTTCPGADLSFANLAGVNLSFADLSGANMKRANLTGTNFAAANLSYADLSDANITGTNFTDSQRNAVILYSTDIDIFGTIVGDMNITTEPEWSTDAHERALASVVPVTPQVPLP
ncbi:pentapeptide repeat-containing protein [Rhodococcus opacus]|nr:pentapeptide repeat-containing protein [Rhodococcus opacus]